MSDTPRQPLKLSGKQWHVGWDIPTKYAVDADGQCWRDYAHGGPLHRCSVHELMVELDYSERREVRLLLGLPAEDEPWMAEARAAGWTPPSEPLSADDEEPPQ